MKHLTLNRIVFILFAALIIAPSCKKNKGEEEEQFKAGTISFKANGTLRTYDVSSFNTFGDGNDFVCYLFASMQDNEQSFVSLRLTSPEPITEKTYMYVDAVMDILVREPGGKEYKDDNSSNTIITITSISDNNVQGTFSGEVANGNEIITVTDGKFDCPRLM